MSIVFVTGNILEDESEALVNPVNTVGIMGKGLALAFKERFPEMFKDYVAACQRKAVTIGEMHCFRAIDHFTEKNERWIVNFPTKIHWRDRSNIKYIRYGLIDLVQALKDIDVKSVAIPPLGCGCGGLQWFEVKDLITEAFKDSEIAVTIYCQEQF